MAITAAITLGSATLTTGQKTAVTCTVSNSGGSAVTVTGIVPLCMPAGSTKRTVAVALGEPPLGPGMTVSVAASGSTPFTWDAVPFAPTSGQGLAMPAQQIYDMGATVYTSDGAITAATTTTLTVNDPVA